MDTDTTNIIINSLIFGTFAFSAICFVTLHALRWKGRIGRWAMIPWVLVLINGMVFSSVALYYRNFVSEGAPTLFVSSWASVLMIQFFSTLLGKFIACLREPPVAEILFHERLASDCAEEVLERLARMKEQPIEYSR